MIHADHGDDREQYIEIWMSETQFARAITSMNMGSGSPCTVNRFNGESIPSPEAEDLQKSHKEMVKEKLEGQLQSLIDIAAPIREKREKKQRLTLADMDRITEELHLAAAHFESNMTYYASTLEEHMEKTVAAAKAEIEVHLMTSAKRLGIPQDEAPPAGAQ